MAFGQNVGTSGCKTRKIRPSGGDLCSFRHVAGRSVQDCGKVVQKLAGREDENHKLCTTLCAPLRLGTRIVQVSFPLGVRCVGVAVRRCAIRSFSSRLRRRGAHLGGGGGAVGGQGLGRRQASAGCCARGRPPLPSPFPIAHSDSAISGRGRAVDKPARGVRTALRPSAGGGAAVGGLTRGERTALRPSADGGTAVDKLSREERTGRSGDCLVHFRLCARRFAHQRAGARQ